ncbi:hypothetical protein B0H19DRAFT_1068878 [Mycena capillaripes]|nr:hypothetical protein B0H19DRAFT_1068878 [Mycena capillaripes]
MPPRFDNEWRRSDREKGATSFDVTSSKIRDHHTQGKFKTLIFPYVQNVYVNFTIQTLDKEAADLLMRFLCALRNVMGLRIDLERTALSSLMDSVGSHSPFPTYNYRSVCAWMAGSFSLHFPA